MIDALFGSKTRVKLLHLFLNNPGKAFYVREITRLIDEQINSVRRELANMLNVGIIESNTSDNKLYYSVNQRYEHYTPLRAIFSDEAIKTIPVPTANVSWHDAIRKLTGLRLAITSGIFVKGSGSSIDLLLVGELAMAKVKQLINAIEKIEGRELNYSVLSYDEFYYRLSVRDRFITEVLHGKCHVLIDEDNMLKSQN